MFGRDLAKDLSVSRIAIRDTTIENVHSLVQNRIRIDRFTGGAYSTALFNEEPIWGSDDSELILHLTLRNPADHEIGLLLLLLKDLWTGDLPVGGESSIGRGRLKGKAALLTLKEPEGVTREWRIKQKGDGLQIDRPDELQHYVDALHSSRWEGKQ